jgi:hypothetical protein
MNRRLKSATAWFLCVVTLASGCAPTQPFFYKEDGDLSHYMNVATEIEYPDVNEQPLDDVAAAQAPLTLANAEKFDIWDLTLEEVTRRTLENSQVIRSRTSARTSRRRRLRRSQAKAARRTTR